MPWDETHGLGDRVEGDVIFVLAALPNHFQRKILVVEVARPFKGIVRQKQQDVLRQDAALLAVQHAAGRPGSVARRVQGGGSEGHGVKCNETKDSYTRTRTIDTHTLS